MMKGKVKSKIKWRLVWSAYLLVAIPIAIPILIFHCLYISFAWLVDKISRFKYCLIEKYKPENID